MLFIIATLFMDRCANVLTAYDCCPFGIDGGCNHVASASFALEEFFRQSKGPVISTLTHVPGKRKFENQPIAPVKFREHQHGKVTKSEEKVYHRPGILEPHINSTHLQILTCPTCFHSVREIENKKEKKMAPSFILPQNTSDIPIKFKAK